MDMSRIFFVLFLISDDFIWIYIFAYNSLLSSWHLHMTPYLLQLVKTLIKSVLKQLMRVE